MAYEITENKKHYSLCQVMVSKSRKPEGKPFVSLLRMADFLGNDPAPHLKPRRTLYKDPIYWDEPKNYILNTGSQYLENNGDVGIWEWGPHINNASKQYSQLVGDDVYEEIALEKLTRNSTAYSPELMDSLFRGVTYNHPLKFPLLLTILQKDDRNICLEIGEEAGTFDEGIFRLKEGAKAKLYSLPTSDFVTTAECYTRCDERQTKNTFLVGRSFYLNYPILGSPIAEVTLYPFAYYISEYLKEIGSGSSPNEYSEIENLRRIFSPESDCVTSFKRFISVFAEGDSTQFFSAYIQEFTNCIKLIDTYLDGKKKESGFLINLIESTPDIKKKYYDKLVEGYLDEAKKDAEDSISDLTEEVQRLEKDKETLSNDIEKFRAEKEQLSQENEKLEQNNKELSEKSAVLQTSLSESTANLFKDLGVMRDVLSLVGAPAEEKPTGQRISRRPYQKLVTESVNVWDMIDSAEDPLVENLEDRGFTKNNPDNLARIILGSHLLRIPLLCFGYSAQRLVETISITLSAEMPSTLCIPSGFNDYTTLLSAVNSSPSSYVILENLVGFTEEYCYAHLSEDAKDKHIIFTVPYKDALKLLPKELYAHFLIVDADKYLDETLSIQKIEAGKIEVNLDNEHRQYRLGGETRRSKADELKKYIAPYKLPMNYQYSRLPLLTLMSETKLEALLKVELETIQEITESE